MQKNIIKRLIKFIFNYIWLFCIVLILLECCSVAYNATVLIKRTSTGILSSTCGEISGRFTGVLQLMNGLVNDPVIADTSLPLFDRATTLLPLQESFSLYMIAMTDAEGNVISADEIAPPEKPMSLMFRDYMQRLYSTGNYQITDPIVAGADNKTVNFTVAVPIIKDDTVEGSVFGAIYFDDIEDIILRNSHPYGRSFHLFGREQSVIAGSGTYPVGTTFDQISENVWFLNTSQEEIEKNMTNHTSDSYWVLRPEGLCYVLYQNVQPADWTLFYRIDFISMIMPLLPVTLLKILFYIAVSVIISSLGKKYIEKRLSSVNLLLDKMSTMQLELFRNENAENADYTTLLDISHQGLMDQLTGLPTRTVLFDKMKHIDYTATCGAVIFIDLDDLKKINDGYGHKAGDMAISAFATSITDFGLDHDIISARYGGDEFILVVTAHEACDVAALAEELCEALRGHFFIDGNRVETNASIGIALFPQDGCKPEDLISKADIALYDAKHRGKNCFCFYSDSVIE